MGSATVVATIDRPPSRTTTTSTALELDVHPLDRRRPSHGAAAAARSASPAAASARARSSPAVRAASTAPSGPAITTSTTCVESSTSSERAAEASMPAPEASKDACAYDAWGTIPRCGQSARPSTASSPSAAPTSRRWSRTSRSRRSCPLIFLALSVLGFLDQADSSSALVSYLEDVFPDQSVESIVNVVDAVQRNATTLSVVGAVALLWSSLSLFSALESAFNILYGRPNRPVPARQGPRERLHERGARRPLRGPHGRDDRLRPAPPLRDATSSRTSGSRSR